MSFISQPPQISYEFLFVNVYLFIRDKSEVAVIGDKMREIRLRWLPHVCRWFADATVRSIDYSEVTGSSSRRGRLGKT